MKKSFVPDYRRETVELLTKSNITAVTIMQELHVSISTAYNWLNGRKSPTRSNFERLKQLSEGKNLHPERNISDPRKEGDDENMELYKAMLLMSNKVDTLTEAITGLVQELKKEKGAKRNIA